MKQKATLILGALLMLFGLLAIFEREAFASRQLVTLGGILFILASFVNEFLPYVLNKYKKKEVVEASKPTRARRILNEVIDCGAALFGLVMLCMVDTFVPYIPVTLGLLILLGCIAMFYNLAVGIRPVQLPGWLFLLPVALLVLAVAVYFQTTPQDDALMIALTGVAAFIYGSGTILTVTMVAKAGRQTAQNNEIKALEDDAE
jgi:hypothetical protein